MKYMATFVFCLFRALYQGTDKILDFPKNLYDEKTKAISIVAGYIDKVPTLVEGREGLIKKIRLYLWIIIDIISLIIDGQWVSCQNVRMEIYGT